MFSPRITAAITTAIGAAGVALAVATCTFARYRNDLADRY